MSSPAAAVRPADVYTQEQILPNVGNNALEPQAQLREQKATNRFRLNDDFNMVLCEVKHYDELQGRNANRSIEDASRDIVDHWLSLIQLHPNEFNIQKLTSDFYTFLDQANNNR